MDLIINTTANSPKTARTSGGAGSTPPLPDLVVSDNRMVNLYFVDGSGQPLEWSGDLDYVVKVAIGKIALPDTITYTLTDGVATTTTLEKASTAAQLQTALNALNTGTGPSAGTVAVVQSFAGFFVVNWNAVGARDLLVAGNVLSDPDGTVQITRLVEGDATHKEIQIIELVRSPAAYQDVWTVIESDDDTPVPVGFSGALGLDALAMRQLLNGATSVSATLEVRVIDPSGNRTTYLQTTVTILDHILRDQTSAGAQLPYSSADNIANKSLITALTGGGAGKLDGLQTTTLPTGYIAAVEVTAGVLEEYRLVAGTDAESSPLVIRPDDYNDSTNAKVWKLKRSGVFKNIGSDFYQFLKDKTAQWMNAAGTKNTNINDTNISIRDAATNVDGDVLWLGAQGLENTDGTSAVKSGISLRLGQLYAGATRIVAATWDSLGVFTIGNATLQGSLKLYANGFKLGLKAPAALAADKTFTLPGADGTSGQAITTDGSGNLTFSTVGAPATATQAEAEAGTDNTKTMTPLRAAQSALANGILRYIRNTEGKTYYVGSGTAQQKHKVGNRSLGTKTTTASYWAGTSTVFIPAFFEKETVVTKFCMGITNPQTATQFRFGVNAADSQNMPGTKLANAQAVTITGSGVYEVTLTNPLTLSGLVWISLQCNAQCTVDAWNWSLLPLFIYGSFPATDTNAAPYFVEAYAGSCNSDYTYSSSMQTVFASLPIVSLIP